MFQKLCVADMIVKLRGVSPLMIPLMIIHKCKPMFVYMYISFSYKGWGGGGWSFFFKRKEAGMK